MADTKISALTAITGANTATDDVFSIVDTSVTTTKKITRAELKIALGVTASSTFTATLTGCTTSPTVTASYSVTNGIVTVYYPTASATSNTTAMTITGAPAAIQPTTAKSVFPCVITDNGTAANSAASVGTDGVVTLFATSGGGAFTASGTKGHSGMTLTYDLT